MPQNTKIFKINHEMAVHAYLNGGERKQENLAYIPHAPLSIK